MKKILLGLLIFGISTFSFSQQASANIKIMLTDADSIAESNAKIKIYSSDKTYNFEGVTDDLGFLKVKLPLAKELHLDVYRFDTVFNFIQTIPMGNYGDYVIPFHLQIQLIKTFTNKYKLPVFFESGKYDVTEQSKTAIDDLFNQMSKNAQMSIEIGAHTDDVGSDSYNQQLSQNRAAAIRTYLVQKGIDGNRIIAKGYGETKPIGDNTTDTGRAMNRRVEISVIESK